MILIIRGEKINGINEQLVSNVFCRTQDANSSRYAVQGLVV